MDYHASAALWDAYHSGDFRETPVLVSLRSGSAGDQVDERCCEQSETHDANDGEN